ncbi:NAD(P)H-dependent flavin oxidoreductase [Shewanella woodyi]|uniref:Propionate 3-nitronate monooxygenase n=1 Tax=Shewanella woodyi (strain ATCC 51908 / MS32) TaxID=392500 RepID=B1KD25_SHEWM|nr:nitronate monooxygenase [Shewanella woodyi]ACA87860.1 2-nitropropane dioxygenase NPD [Shewanella woodyi ATCC 51908]
MKTRFLCQQLGTQYPIIQAPMAGGILSADFIAKVCEFGLLGSIPSGYLTLAQLDTLIQSVKSKTDKPFQVNLFVDHCEYPDKVAKPAEVIEIEKHLGIFTSLDCQLPKHPSASDIIDLVIAHQVPIISTTFGVLRAKDYQRYKDAGGQVMVTVNSLDEAHKVLSEANADMIVYQNALAGGHKGGFNDAEYDVEAVMLTLKRDYPYTQLIKSGGIVNQKDIVFALEKGFDGVQIGTGFLMTQESSASQTYKQALLGVCDDNQLMQTTSITGRQARGIVNELAMLELERSPLFPQQHYATKTIREHAKSHDLPQYQSLWAGNGAVNITSLPELEDYMFSLVYG